MKPVLSRSGVKPSSGFGGGPTPPLEVFLSQSPPIFPSLVRWLCVFNSPSSKPRPRLAKTGRRRAGGQPGFPTRPATSGEYCGICAKHVLGRGPAFRETSRWGRFSAPAHKLPARSKRSSGPTGVRSLALRGIGRGRLHRQRHPSPRGIQSVNGGSRDRKCKSGKFSVVDGLCHSLNIALTVRGPELPGYFVAWIEEGSLVPGNDAGRTPVLFWLFRPYWLGGPFTANGDVLSDFGAWAGIGTEGRGKMFGLVTRTRLSAPRLHV